MTHTYAKRRRFWKRREDATHMALVYWRLFATFLKSAFADVRVTLSKLAHASCSGVYMRSSHGIALSAKHSANYHAQCCAVEHQCRLGGHRRSNYRTLRNEEKVFNLYSKVVSIRRGLHISSALVSFPSSGVCKAHVWNRRTTNEAVYPKVNGR